MSKVTLELRISPEMSCLQKIQVKKSGSSVKTEKVKDHRKKELNAISPTWLCYTDSSSFDPISHSGQFFQISSRNQGKIVTVAAVIFFEIVSNTIHSLKNLILTW